jgi:filamentous hemagglutinin family protein
MQTNLHLVLLTLVGLMANIPTTLAQTYQPSNRVPVADGTLGTQVLGVNNNFDIVGGLDRGQTLFHSFTDFSVPTNGRANFLNLGGKRDIITRVTGGLFSDINGIVNTNGANFLLINPQGIVFGPNARLNLGKAFVASTATGVDFVDPVGKTYNFGVNGAGDGPLIAVNPNVLFNPSKLIMGGNSSGSSGIVNYGTLQTANQGQYIGLIGGNITMNGGKIVAPGGRVDLGGLNSAGTIGIDSQGLVFGGNSLVRSDISLLNGAQVAVRADKTLGTVDPFFNNASSPGSSINISANNVRLANDKSVANPTPSSLDAGLTTNSIVKIASTGDVRIDSTGDLTLANGSFIRNTIQANATGQIGNINIKAKNLRLTDRSLIRSTSLGEGNAGNINITAGEVSLSGISDIQAGSGGKGNGGDIRITTTGNISLAADNSTAEQSKILANTNGSGDSGKITLDTQGDLLLTNSGIFAVINPSGVGNSKGIEIKAKNIGLSNGSQIAADNFGRGNAGNIDLKTTGNLTISGTEDKSLLQGNLFAPLSSVSSATVGAGDSGKITIDTNGGDLSLSNRSAILAGITGKGTGNSQGIEIRANNLTLSNISNILAGNLSTNGGEGKGGNIDIKTTGNLNIAGIEDTSLVRRDSNNFLSGISTQTGGKGDSGKITIDTKGDLSISNQGAISAGILKTGEGNSKGIDIKARNIKLNNLGVIETINEGGKGDAGIINIQAKGKIEIQDANKNPNLVSSRISSKSEGLGKANDISISAQQIDLNGGNISTQGSSVSGGNIFLTLDDLLLLRNDGGILTNSDSTGKNSSGGNITINSPLIVAAPGNNDITANANGGSGGNINITTQGLFGIQYRPKGQESPLTNDITASSTFGQNGNVRINTPGVDPGKDTGELPAAPNDASKQISQTCSASQRDNKFYITGRGGLPPNASDLQESEALWQDAREVKTKPAPTASQPQQFAPPAIGWVFQQDGRVRLIAAQTAGSPTGTRVVCPNVTK